MTNQWKPIGDKWPQPAMVLITTGKSGRYRMQRSYGQQDDVLLRFLHAMPPTITPKQQAVLDAVETAHQQRDDFAAADRGYAPAYAEYIKAITAVWTANAALRAAQQPPDPVQELREARALQRVSWQPSSDNALNRNYVQACERIDAAIAALKAKS